MTITSEPTKSIDPYAVRADFPILQTTVHGKPLVYLDSASTSQKPNVVIDAPDEALHVPQSPDEEPVEVGGAVGGRG